MRPRAPTRSSRDGLHRRLRDHRRADRPAHRRPGQGRARDADRGPRARAAHGSTPWLGDNAVLKAIDVFRAIESLPFARESSELFDRPSINLGRIIGGDALNKVPDDARWTSTSATCPARTRARSCARSGRSPDVDVARTFIRAAARSSTRNEPVRARAPRGASRARRDGESMSVGRDGASDAICVPRGGRAGGRVRPGRRRPPRPRRVGLDRLARALPAGAGRLRAQLPCAARATVPNCAPSRAASRERDRIPGAGLLKRALLGGVLIVVAVGDRDRRRRCCSRSTRSSQDVHREAGTSRHPGDHAGAGGQPADDPDPRLRRAATATRSAACKPRSDTIMLVRLDPDKRRSRVHVAPARPEGRRSPGTATDKINAAYELGGPQLTVATVKQPRPGTPDQPRHQRRLRRLPPGRRTRSAASTSTSTAATSTTTPAAGRALRRRSTSSPATRSSAGHDALDYVRYRHERQRPRARRAPAGLPAPGQAPGQRRASCSTDRDKRWPRSSAHYTVDRHPLARRSVLELLKLALFSAEHKPIQRGPLPRARSARPTSTPRRAGHPRQASREFMSGEAERRPARSGAARRAAAEGRRAQATARQARRSAGSSTRKPPARSRRSPRPHKARLPVLLPDASVVHGLARIVGRAARLLRSTRPEGQAPPRLPDGRSTRARRRVLRRPGH